MWRVAFLQRCGRLQGDVWATLLPLPVKSVERRKLLLAFWEPGLARLFSPAPQPPFLCCLLAFLKLRPFPRPLCGPRYSSPAPSISAHPLRSVCGALVRRAACLGVAVDAEGYLVVLLRLGLERPRQSR